LRTNGTNGQISSSRSLGSSSACSCRIRSRYSFTFFGEAFFPQGKLKLIEKLSLLGETPSPT
jgi:hypothetical protein